MKASELLRQLAVLISIHGDVDVVHFEVDKDGDVCIDDLRTCQYEAALSDNYLDERRDKTSRGGILVY